MSEPKPSRVSFLLVFCCLIATLSGCSTGGWKVADPQLGLMEARQWESRFTPIDSEFTVHYRRYFTNRLVQAIALKHPVPIAFAMRFVRSDQPFAFSPGGGRIIVSDALVRVVANEAELAFVVAHEMGHYLLGHSAEILAGTVDIEQRREFEIEADRFALGAIALAGYEPRVAPSAVRRLSRYMQLGPNQTHPGVPERIVALNQILYQNPTLRGGTVKRRDFNKLKMAMLQ